MKIGYFLGSAGISSGGVGPYAWRVLELLLKNSRCVDIKILILCTKETHDECLLLINKYQAQASVSVCLRPSQSNFVNRLFRRLGLLLSSALNKLGIDNRIDLVSNPSYRWFASLDIDLLHVPYQTPPLYDLPYPFIVTMHDVQELHFPEFFKPDERAWRAEHYWKSLLHASGVIVSFDHVKQDLIKYFDLPQSKVFVCPLPYTQISFDSLQEKESSKNLVKKYSGFKEFVFYPAQTWEHKNHLSLIKAIELANEWRQGSIHLVCTGKINSYFYKVIEGYIASSPISEQIHFMGIVPEAELYWLYKNCALVVVPTLYEAGSFPLLEAMCLGVPVVCSSVTSLPETIGDSRFIFDPLDIEEMSKLILEMVASVELSQANIANSVNRVRQLRKIDSWKPIFNAWHSTLNF